LNPFRLIQESEVAKLEMAKKEQIKDNEAIAKYSKYLGIK